MEITREVGEKGQVVIPMDIRNMLGIKKKSKIIFEVENNQVKIKKQDSKRILDEFFTSARMPGKGLTLKELKEIEEESYDLP